jgi:hypothetical protein
LAQRLRQFGGAIGPPDCSGQPSIQHGAHRDRRLDECQDEQRQPITISSIRFERSIDGYARSDRILPITNAAAETSTAHLW